MTTTAAVPRLAERPQPRRRGSGRPGSGAEAALNERLRAETRDAHVAAERAFDLERRLRSLGGYGDALLGLRAWGSAGAPALASLAPALPAPLRDGPERRRARLAADLTALGRVGERAAAPAARDEAFDADRALGAWYVHEGAALGGLLIAAEVRRRLPAAAAATRYFAGEGRATAARWRCVQDVLAGWCPADGAAAGNVVDGARAEFAALIATMGASTP